MVLQSLQIYFLFTERLAKNDFLNDVEKHSSLSFLSWIKNEMISLLYLWINVGNINSEIQQKSFHFWSSLRTRDQLKFYRLSGATFYDWFFDLGFTALSRIFHLYRADRSSKVGENRSTRRKTTWPSVSRTWLSHIWPERGSNHSDEKPNGLRVNSLIH